MESIIFLKKIQTLRIKYYFYSTDRLTLFFCCLARRTKKLTWLHLLLNLPETWFLELILCAVLVS